jgi:hypothetical protein
VFVAVALVALAGIAIYFATHAGDKPTPVAHHESKVKEKETRHAVVADAAIVAAPVDAAVRAPIPVDASIVQAKVDAGVKKHVAVPTPPPPPPPDDDKDDDALSAEKLRQAEEALRDSQWPRAEQLANAVLNSDDSKPKQKARAAMIHGMVQCLGRNNEEGALTDLRRMKGAYPFLRKRLLVACQKAGFLNGQR